MPSSRAGRASCGFSGSLTCAGPPDAKSLRERTEAKGKKGYAAPDVGP